MSPSTAAVTLDESATEELAENIADNGGLQDVVHDVVRGMWLGCLTCTENEVSCVLHGLLARAEPDCAQGVKIIVELHQSLSVDDPELSITCITPTPFGCTSPENCRSTSTTRLLRHYQTRVTAQLGADACNLIDGDVHARRLQKGIELASLQPF